MQTPCPHPCRYVQRDPVLATVGRLDADTTGLLLMTDEGELLHRITSPKRSIWKVYEAVLAQDLSGTARYCACTGPGPPWYCPVLYLHWPRTSVVLPINTRRRNNRAKPEHLGHGFGALGVQRAV